MELLVLIVIVIIVISFFKSKKSGISLSNSLFGAEPTSPYHYGRKKYLMTQAENNFFKLLISSVGDRVNVFPQVRLSALLYRAKGIEHRYWYAALSRINQKSVDYILCDKLTGEILLAIELDDITHDTVIRQKRDSDVNEMLKEAGMPFMRFRDIRNLTQNIIRSQIYEILPYVFEQPKTYIPERHEV
jgi:very-short-patch-repair endonuclease